MWAHNNKELVLKFGILMKKIYIAGCGGMLGEAFYMQFKDDYKLMKFKLNNNDDIKHIKKDIINYKIVKIFVKILLFSS